MLKKNALRSAVLAAFCAASFNAPAMADAATDINIPAGSLAEALEALAKHYGLFVLYESAQLEGLTTVGVSGQFESKEAFQKLIEGTPLVMKKEGQGIVISKPQQRIGAVALDDERAGAAGSTQVNDLRSVSTLSHLVLAQAASESPLSGPGSGERSGDFSGLEEIVVTAQRRKENVQDVPISVAVLKGKDLDNSSFSGIMEALRSVPSVDFSVDQYGGGSVVFVVRGVSNSAASNGGAGPIAYYLDGVPYGFIRNAFYPDPAVYDLDRVEFLSGPQGTLYGAGSLNGTLRIFTHDADVDAFDFKFRTLISTTEDGGQNEGGDLALNVPLVPGVLGVRAVVGLRNDDGWVDSRPNADFPGPDRDDVNDNEARNYRVRLRAEPSDTLAISLSAWHSEDDIGAPSLSNDQGEITTPVPEYDQPQGQEFDVYALNLENEFQAFTLSSNTSLMDYNQVSRVSGTPVGFPGFQDYDRSSRVVSQELNLISNGEGPWRWSTGAFYRDAEDAQIQELILDIPGPDPETLLVRVDNYEETSESYAVYGELTRELSAQWALTGGLRFFHDEQILTLRQDYDGRDLAPEDGNPDYVLADGTAFTGKHEAWTPRVVLTWTPSPHHSLYASYSQGFRSGLNQEPSVLALYPQFAPADPDRLTNYEISSKGSALNGRFSYEAALFYIDWQDVQQSLSVPIPDTPLLAQAIVNGEGASGVGASLSASYHVTDDLRVGITLGWNDLHADEDIVSGEGTPEETVFLRKGERLLLSPEWTAAFNGGYGWNLGGDYRAEINLDGRYTSEQTSASLGGAGPSDTIFTLNGGFHIEAPKNWGITLFGDNLTDEDGTPSPRAAVALEWSPRIRPRTWGIQLTYDY